MADEKNQASDRWFWMHRPLRILAEVTNHVGEDELRDRKQQTTPGKQKS